jgi:hypothetical protein
MTIYLLQTKQNKECLPSSRIGRTERDHLKQPNKGHDLEALSALKDLLFSYNDCINLDNNKE